MTRLHLTLGLLIIAGTIAVGIFTGQLNIFEGFVLVLIVAVLVPFIWKFIKETPKHDDR